MRHAKPSATTCLGTPARCALFAAGLLLLAGCNLTGQNTTQGNGTTPAAGSAGTSPTGSMANDPLLGGGTALPAAGTAQPPNRAVATTPTPQPPTGATGGVPPIPPPSSTTSPAVLAGGGVRGNLNADGRDLRISSGSPAPGGVGDRLPDPWQKSPVTSTPQGGGSGVALTSGVGNSEAFKQLQFELVTKRNVVWQKFEMQDTTGQWKYSCSIPNRKDPSYRTLVEVRAADALEAMQLAINKIDADQK